MVKLRNGNLVNPEHVSAVVKEGPNYVLHLISGSRVVIDNADIDDFDDSPKVDAAKGATE